MPHATPRPAPTVSVVMAVYQGAAHVEAAIASLIAQTFADFELIVIDDASTDATLARVRSFDDPRIIVIPLAENVGPVVARNHGFAVARGRHIAGLDHDDLCRPDRLAQQVAYLDAHPDTVLVATGASVLEDGRTHYAPPVPRTTPALIDWLMQTRNPLIWSSAMFRADAMRRLDPVGRADRRYAEDFDLYHRLRAFGEIARIDADLVTYRHHPGNASTRYSDVMSASAIAVLGEVYRPLFGNDAPTRATAMVRHAGLCLPVQSKTTLIALADTIHRLHTHFIVSRTMAGSDRRLIDRYYAALWRQFAHSALACGAVSFGDALHLRPPDLGLIAARPWRTAFHALRRTKS